MRRRPLTFLAAAALAGLILSTAGAASARADCQLQWVPDPFGDSGGSLQLVCGPDSPTGGVDDSDAKRAKKKKQKPPPSYASIAVNVTDLNDGDLSFSGVYAAGYAKKKAAINAAVRSCQRRLSGTCKSFALARNGWAALVATLRPDGTLTAFGGRGKTYAAAFADAERRARAAFGGTAPYEIQRVRAVRSRAR